MRIPTDRRMIFASVAMIAIAFLGIYGAISVSYQRSLVSNTSKGSRGSPSCHPLAQLSMGKLHAGAGITSYTPGTTNRFFGGSYYELGRASSSTPPRYVSEGAFSLTSTRGHCIGITVEIDGRNFALLLPLAQ